MGDGLINPELFPARAHDLDTGKIRASATGARTMGKAVNDKTVAIDGAWNGLPANYQAPEQDRVYALMKPAVASAGELKSTFDSMAGHLDTYASALDGIKPRLQDLEQRAAAFRAEVVNGVEVDASEAAGASFGDNVVGAFDWVPGVDEDKVTVPWYEDSDSVEKNSELLGEYAKILHDITVASSQCANDINGLVKNTDIPPVEAIPAEAFTNNEQPMPWGNPRDEDRNCPESVGHGAYNFGAGLLTGAGQLILGYNPQTGGWFEGSAYGQAWGGLGDLIGSTLLFASPVGWVANGMAAAGMDNEFLDWMDDRAKTVVGGWGALVGYDINAKDGWHKWKDDPWAAGTESVLNVGTFFIPGAGEVAGAVKVGATGAKVVRIAATVAEFAIPGGSWVLKGGIKVVAGLGESVRFADDAARVAGHAPRLPVGLIDAVDDLPLTEPPRTPVTDSVFPPSGTRVPSFEGDRVPSAVGDGVRPPGNERVPAGTGDGARPTNERAPAGVGDRPTNSRFPNERVPAGVGAPAGDRVPAGVGAGRPEVGSPVGRGGGDGGGSPWDATPDPDRAAPIGVRDPDGHPGVLDPDRGAPDGMPREGSGGPPPRVPDTDPLPDRTPEPDPTPGGRADDGPTGRGDDGPTGRGDDGPTGRGDDGPTGRGDDGPADRGDEGPADRGDEGPADRGDEGPGDRSDDGPGNRGDDGPGNRGDDGPAGRGDDGPADRTDGREPYDPDAPPRRTVPQNAAQSAQPHPAQGPPTEADIQRARDNAPVDEQGRPVDHRNGNPLLSDSPDGRRRWHLKWDPDRAEWVAENPGSGEVRPGLAPHGEPNSFGYDANGERMPFANDRPAYGDGQVESVWDRAEREGGGEVWVEGPDGELVRIEWDGQSSRRGVWDMGHRAGEEYRELRRQYLNHEIDLKKFLEEYRNPDNYQVEHPLVNQSHKNEAP